MIRKKKKEKGRIVAAVATAASVNRAPGVAQILEASIAKAYQEAFDRGVSPSDAKTLTEIRERIRDHVLRAYGLRTGEVDA